MVKRASPGVGHNAGSDVAKQSDFRFHLAMEVLDQEEAAKLRERRKKHRKLAEGKSIVLEDLDRLYKMKDLTAAEVEQWFKRQWNALGAVFTDLHQQFSLFAPKPSAPESRAAFKHAGLMAGLQGKPRMAPPPLAGDDLQQWLGGHSEGTEFRNAAERERLEEIKKALDNAEKGIVTDGTGKKTGRVSAAAQRVRDQAAADFKADNPDVQVPGETTADDFEASPDELSKQKGRPAAAAAVGEKLSQSQKAAQAREQAGTA